MLPLCRGHASPSTTADDYASTDRRLFFHFAAVRALSLLFLRRIVVHRQQTRKHSETVCKLYTGYRALSGHPVARLLTLSCGGCNNVLCLVKANFS